MCARSGLSDRHGAECTSVFDSAPGGRSDSCAVATESRPTRAFGDPPRSCSPALLATGEAASRPSTPVATSSAPICVNLRIDLWACGAGSALSTRALELGLPVLPGPPALEPKQPRHLDDERASLERHAAAGRTRVLLVGPDDEELAAGPVLPAERRLLLKVRSVELYCSSALANIRGEKP